MRSTTATRILAPREGTTAIRANSLPYKTVRDGGWVAKALLAGGA